VGRGERLPEADPFTVERTVDRAALFAELELVASIAVALVLSSTWREVLRLTTDRDVLTTAFALCTERSR
jgi:hypothetical protein